jgi:cysteine synthase A
VDVCAFGVGTGGTITGAGTYLKQRNPNIQVRLLILFYKIVFKLFAVEPEESAVLSGNQPGPHKIQGCFVTSYLFITIFQELVLVSFRVF